MAAFINPKEKEENRKLEEKLRAEGTGAIVFQAAARNDIVALDRSMREFEKSIRMRAKRYLKENHL
jgi:hypothetical protein